MFGCRRKIVASVLGWLLLASGEVWADDDPFQTHVRAGREDGVSSERAHSAVSRSDIERRQPRSAPDALRYESGVFVQQSAHGQGSAFIRGL
ncbi:MAG TPA: hypothetical protein PK472_17720, partial [Pseudomonadota bacterium]|nr:hypothetical protein [Pseudomonadota bacterium]